MSCARALLNEEIDINASNFSMSVSKGLSLAAFDWLVTTAYCLLS